VRLAFNSPLRKTSTSASVSQVFTYNYHYRILYHLQRVEKKYTAEQRIRKQEERKREGIFSVNENV